MEQFITIKPAAGWRERPPAHDSSSSSSLSPRWFSCSSWSDEEGALARCKDAGTGSWRERAVISLNKQLQRRRVVGTLREAPETVLSSRRFAGRSASFFNGTITERTRAHYTLDRETRCGILIGILLHTSILPIDC